MLACGAADGSLWCFALSAAGEAGEAEGAADSAALCYIPRGGRRAEPELRVIAHDVRPFYPGQARASRGECGVPRGRRLVTQSSISPGRAAALGLGLARVRARARARARARVRARARARVSNPNPNPNPSPNPNQASSGAMLIACFSSGLVVGAPLKAFRSEERRPL